MSSELPHDAIESIYRNFESPLATLDCGRKCSPYNQNGVPFCCDTRHAVPTAYHSEWLLLEANTDLWHPWQDSDQEETARLRAETPDGLVLIECLGHQVCQREYRSIVCRAFPFFPYVNSSNLFIGLTYYWEYEDRCWVISNLEVVTQKFILQFVLTYDHIFAEQPGELENFRYHSDVMLQEFAGRGEDIPILHRDGGIFQIAPEDESMHQVEPDDLPKFGPYEVAAMLPFPDER
jgi:hypothetical protein